MFKIYKHSHFLPDAFGHGGNKRTAQISEILINAGITAGTADLANNFSANWKILLYLKGLGHNPNLKTGHKNKYAVGRYIKLFEEFVREQKPHLFIWESTVEYNLLLAEVLYKNNISAIALPHNIESMVAGSKSVFSGKMSPDWLLEELRYLGYCKKTYTISREEQWLLSNAGLNASYLPYYPPREAEQFLLSIRKKRQHIPPSGRSTKNILLLGTFHNKPTFDGYFDLLKHIENIQGLKIQVAGFGSERLKDTFKGSHIHIWGGVDNDTLSRLITASDCAIIHQQPSGGALTRVPELLLAGLPLILNIHAARSCFDLKGIAVYDSYPQLLDMLHEIDLQMPPLISRPLEEKQFAEYINSCIPAGHPF
ncbi:hypothetical protein [Mucilaginibacter aquariorum]|uniref:Glycosyltransferase n=1 Tax=Mucilaginibacter aquariorum TaxID=2967225 RepID=A0ABT1SZX0_9SPHI|nr:hypothetical protein [Mucilaginibacter aquariorum]MCQ6957278.1 hypothetical protein [Mucilaginibacter aquariorum]